MSDWFITSSMQRVAKRFGLPLPPDAVAFKASKFGSSQDGIVATSTALPSSSIAENMGTDTYLMLLLVMLLLSMLHFLFCFCYFMAFGFKWLGYLHGFKLIQC